MSIRSFITVAASVLALMACQKTAEPVPELVPMSFCPADGQEVYGFTTKADPLVSNTTHTQMKVWGTRIDASSSTALIPGYKVEYSNTEGWQYNHITGQSLKYWDTFAQSFRFHAGVPYSAVSAMGAGSLKLALKATSNVAETALYSEPKVVNAGDAAFGNTVALSFKQTCCRVQFKFKTRTNTTEAKTITNIELKPLNPDRYIATANLNIAYNWATQAADTTITNMTYSSKNAIVQYGTVTLAAPGQTYKASSTPYWYFPAISKPAHWHLRITLDGVTRVATIDAGLSNAANTWLPGKSFTYNINVSTDAIWVGGVSVEQWTDETIDVEIGD